jgi:hypothetical protein
LPLPRAEDRVCEAIVGPTGYGKSTLKAEVIERGLQKHGRIIELLPDDKEPADPNVIVFRDWRTFWTTMRDKKPSKFHVAFKPGERYFPAVCALAWLLAPCLLVIEESGKYYGPDIYYRDELTGRHVQIPREFVELCERGRHAGPRSTDDLPVDLLIIALDATRIQRCARRELRRISAFCLPTPEERKWLAEAPNCNAEIAELTKDLPKFTYLKIDTENGGYTRETTSRP